ncbi:MAG: Rrf2 family transcriptional regulator [Bacteroidetes bacterium]|nr:Rrf2 family transcriptional regulator [Bacteroidota bacterium]MBS1630624.1 Rrf2 family transcriptional regulator [Bacteroidota bacterium]
MLSKTCEYGIRAMLFVAQQSSKGKKAGIREIATNVEAPEPFIAKILQNLGKKKLVQSAKGPNGGFFLDEQGLNQSLADIVAAIDGDKIFSGCGLGLSNCSDQKPCPIHFQFKQIRDDLQTLLMDAKLGQFNFQLENQLAYLKRN